MIGSIGEIVFESDSEKSVMTFDNLSVNRQADYAEHSILSKRGLLEFTGLKAETCSFTMLLDMSLGVNPSEQIRKLTEMLESHEAVNFILEGIPQGHGQWVIESLDVKHNIIDNNGYTRQAEVSIKLREYISDE